MNKKVLVSGATGKHGRTGYYLAQKLMEEGYDLNCITRNSSRWPDDLTGNHVTVFNANFNDIESLQNAMQGCTAAYFTYPVDKGVVTAAQNFITAAEGANIQQIVVNSMAASNPKSPSRLAQAQYEAEELFANSKITSKIIRVAAFYFENIYQLHGDSILKEGEIRNCFGDARVSWVGARDVGALLAWCFIHFDTLSQDVYYPGTPFHYSQNDIAEKLTNILGRTIVYDPVTKDEWIDELVNLSSNNQVINADMAQHIANLADYFRNNQNPPPQFVPNLFVEANIPLTDLDSYLVETFPSYV